MKNRIAFVLLNVFVFVGIAKGRDMTVTDIQRERIVMFSREGDAQLESAIIQLLALYHRTQDLKVRDDLIALMLRKGQFKQALDLCSACELNKFSESELENLAKAARNIKQFKYSSELYKELESRFPSNQNGLLGIVLVETELGNYELAKKLIHNYRQKFGKDIGIIDAQRYLADHTDPDMVKLGRWQKELLQSPKNLELARKLYLLAAKYKIFSLQQDLSERYSDVFNRKDQLWREQGEAVSLAKGDVSTIQIRQAYKKLTHLLTELDVKHPLYIQSLRDRFVLSTRLRDLKLARENYNQLIAIDDKPPSYVQEAYADLLLAESSPFKALELYQQIASQSISQKKSIADALLFKLANAASDAGKFSLAKSYLSQVKATPYVNDFTRTRRIPNPSYDRLYLNNVHLALWRGDSGLAEKLLSERLNNKAPGDGWAMLAKSEVEQARSRQDESVYWAERASDLIGDRDQRYINIRLAEVALDIKDFRTAHQIIQNFTDSEKETANALILRDKTLRLAHVDASFGLSHRTSPTSESNESTQDYKTYTPKTTDGHSAYVHYLETKSPSDKSILKQRRIGAGAVINFYPVELQLEAGKGIKLNRKAYLSANLGYRLNQHWQFNLLGALNSSSTPVRAIEQGIYAKDLGFSTTYTYSDRLRTGIGANFSRLDDGNLRQDWYWWGSLETFRYDRWILTNTLRFDYEKNKAISTAYYYNPNQSRSFDVNSDLAYIQPFDGNLRLIHHLRGGIGQFSQTNQASEKKWSMSYAHEWRLGRKWGLTYEVGRKKNIYDGNAEYNNFGNLNFSFYF